MWVKSGLVHLPNTSTYRQSEIFKDLMPTGTNWYQRSLLYESKTGIFNLNPHMTVEELWPYYHDGKKLPLKDILIKCNGFGPFKIFKGYLNGTPDQIEYNSPFIKDIHFNRELLQKTGDVAEDITMTFQASSGLEERVFFEEWQELAFNKKTWNIGYYNDYVSEVDIYILDRQDQRQFGIKLHEAFPKTIGPTELNQNSNNEIIKLTVNFSFKYWTTLDRDRAVSLGVSDDTSILNVNSVERNIVKNFPAAVKLDGQGRVRGF